MFTVHLHRAHATPVASGHPWVFAQAVHRISGKPAAGDEVLVLDPQDKPLGRGFWSPDSAIVVRLLTRRVEQELDQAFFIARIRAASAARALLRLPAPDTDGYRLVHAEGDGLAGLVVDVYGDVHVVQFLTQGMARRRELVVNALREVLAPRSIVSAPGNAAQAREGITEHSEVLAGEVPEALRFRERGFGFSIPYERAQKTGYYFDQREHRAEVEHMAAGRDVLDACSYVGAFSLAAARGGARSVLALDSSQAAVDQGAEFARSMGYGQIRFERADVRNELERLHQEHASFDLVVFDPPKLVPTAKHLEKGRRAYRKLNAHAISLVRPGGVLVTCSCSAAMNETEFLRMLAFASHDVGRELCVLKVGRQAPDHPLLPGFSEGSYLKTVFAVVR
jgi:23S rRNA (cytosine1962-C5)-methyltransferase